MSQGVQEDQTRRAREAREAAHPRRGCECNLDCLRMQRCTCSLHVDTEEARELETRNEGNKMRRGK